MFNNHAWQLSYGLNKVTPLIVLLIKRIVAIFYFTKCPIIFESFPWLQGESELVAFLFADAVGTDALALVGSGRKAQEATAAVVVRARVLRYN